MGNQTQGFSNFNVMTQVNLGSKQLLLMNSDNE